MKITPLPEILKQCAALPFNCVFSEHGGYDCMTSAFYIKIQDGPIVATVDLGSFGQKPCQSIAEALPKAQATAAYLTHAANCLPGLVEALRECREMLAVAMNAEENPFGIHHNQATDAIGLAESALSIATNVPVNS